MESPDISVVVLAYRSASTIEGFVASLVTSLEEEKIDWEIILVGNYFEGAGDQTPEVVQRISDGNPRIKTVVKGFPKFIEGCHTLCVYVVDPVGLKSDFGFRAAVNSADIHFTAFHKSNPAPVIHYAKCHAPAAGRDFFGFTAIIRNAINITTGQKI